MTDILLVRRWRITIDDNVYTIEAFENAFEQSVRMTGYDGVETVYFNLDWGFSAQELKNILTKTLDCDISESETSKLIEQISITANWKVENPTLCDLQ